MKTLIRLLLEEQSDLGLHSLSIPVCLKTLDHYGSDIKYNQLILDTKKTNLLKTYPGSKKQKC